MFFRIGHIEDTRTFAHAIGVEILILVGLVEARANLVDVFEACWIVDCDFVGCDADDWAVFFMERVDVVGSAAAEDCYFQAPVYEDSVPWSWYTAKRSEEGSVYDLSMLEGCLEDDGVSLPCMRCRPL